MSKKTNPAEAPETPAATPAPTSVDITALATAIAQAVAAAGNSSADKLSAIAQQLANNAPIRKVSYAEYIARAPKRKAKLHGNFFQHGQPISERQLSDEDITMLNQLKPGKYLDNKIIVEQRGTKDDLSTFIHWACQTVNQRFEIAALAPNFTGLMKLVIADQEARDSK